MRAMLHDGWLGSARRAAALGTMLALAVACGGSDAPEDQAPARGGATGVATGVATGEVAGGPAGGFANGGNAFDTVPAAGTSGSGTAAVGGPAGNTGVAAGAGTLQSGDPSDAAIRSAIDLVNAAEVEMSQLGATRARDAEVKRYANEMIAAHRAAPLDRAVEAAGSNSASDLIAPLRAGHQKWMQTLQNTPAGPAFDRSFIAAQVEAHQGTLQLLDKLGESASDAALTDRLRTMQGAVRGHLQRAQSLRQRVGAGAAQ